MEKIIRRYFWNCVYVCIAGTFVLSPIQLSAEECDCQICTASTDTEIDYNHLGDFTYMLKEFEKRSVEEENLCQKGVLRKWCKKAKRWFLIRTSRVLKKLVKFGKIRTVDEAAYEVARFKRRVDKNLWKTGDVETMLSGFDVETNNVAAKDMGKFKERIRYFYHNKKARPSRVHKGKKDDKHDDGLDDIPIRAVFGGLEVCVGTLIHVLPYPGCMWLGKALIGHGVSQITEGYLKQYEDQHKKELLAI